LQAHAVADFSGPLVAVLDGDTIEVLHNNRAERIRLKGRKWCEEKTLGCVIDLLLYVF